MNNQLIFAILVTILSGTILTHSGIYFEYFDIFQTSCKDTDFLA